MLTAYISTSVMVVSSAGILGLSDYLLVKETEMEIATLGWWLRMR